MKKLIVISIAALLVLGISTAFAAGPDSENVGVDLNVSGDFSIDVSTVSVDLGSAAQGGATAAGATVGVTCFSNSGVSWSVDISGPALTHADTVTTIPSDPNLKVYGFKTGGDGSVDIITATALPVAATTFYSSAINDTGQDTFNLEIPIVTIPADQKAGAYTTTITLSMHE